MYCILSRAIYINLKVVNLNKLKHCKSAIMKNKSQKSILSFFGPTSKVTNKNISSTAVQSSNINENTLKRNIDEDSPIKTGIRRKARAIESDSEEDNDTPAASISTTEEKENKVLSPQKKKVRKKSPSLSPPSKSKEEVIILQSPKNEPSASKSKVGFSPDTVPPLRKTARKQMNRRPDSIESQQVVAIKKIKESPRKSPSSPFKKDKASKRTNCLDKFVFVKTPRSSSSSSKKESEKALGNAEENNSSPVKNDIEKKDISPRSSSSSVEAPENVSSKEVIKEVKTIDNVNKNEEVEDVETPDKEKELCNSEILNSVNDLDEQKSPVCDENEKPLAIPRESNSEIPQTKNEDKNSSTDEEEPSVSTSMVKSPDVSPSKCVVNDAKSSPSKINSEEKSQILRKGDSKETSPQSSPIKEESDSEKPAPKNPFSFSKQDTKEEHYKPDKVKYDPIEDASWKRGEDVPFSALSKTFEIIEETSGRLKTIEILSNFFRSVIILSPKDFLHCVYLCLNKVAPSFEGTELGIGEIYVCRAVAQVTGRSVSMIKSEIAEKGDLGIVAEHSKSNQRVMFQPARLTVKKVFANLKEMALMSGQSSQNKKIDKIKTMFVACKGSEARFLVRFCGGKLRIGLAEQSVLQAIAQACFLTPPCQNYPPEVLNAGKGLSPENLKAKVDEFAAILKTTYCECPSFDSIVPVILEKGMKELPNYCKLEPGVPLKPMLAHPTKGVAEVLRRFEKSKFTCEFKYDGERAQIHLKEDGTVSIFSRNQENNTSKYPDIIARLKDSLGSSVQSCIIDSEAVAYDLKENKILPFQILSTRKRKDANESEIKVQVCVFPFDLLYLNGRNLVTEPFQVRRDLLKENFIEKEGHFLFAKSMDSSNTEDIEEFLEESIKGNCEGLMVKSLDVDATYEIAKRSRNWLKLKKDYLEGIGDTIDVVVIGGYLGKGKRTGTYGGFLLACYDPENEEFQSLCKIGTGFTEEALQTHTNYLKEHIIESPKSYYRYDSNLAPDHWFDATQVWEIKCADLSISPVHKAASGIVDPEKGISLRFPRFLRIRDDKNPENATSASQIAELYRNQEQIKNQTESCNNEEDFY